ncbi:MAG: hypothetical protein L0H25_03380 [Micrococcales bacterium]|nr:hypothetical protein [Micrococcales bacterium]
MSEFIEQIRERVHSVLQDLDRARRDGDDYAVQVHTGQLESLARVAAEHGVSLPVLEAYNPA